MCTIVIYPSEKKNIAITTRFYLTFATMINKEVLELLAEQSQIEPKAGGRVTVPFLQNQKMISELHTALLGLKNGTPLLITMLDGDSHVERSIILHPPIAVDLISSSDFMVTGHVDHLGAVSSVNLSLATRVLLLPEVEFKESNPEDLSPNLQRTISSESTKALPKGLNMSKVSMRQFYGDLSVYLRSKQRSYSIGIRETYYTQIVRPKFQKQLKSKHPGLKIFIEVSYKLDDANSGTAYLKLILQGKGIDFNVVLKTLKPAIKRLPDPIWDFSVGEQRNTTLLAKKTFSQLGYDVLKNGKDFTKTKETRACFDWYIEQLDLLITDVFSEHLTVQ
jgi:hypothetical protein